MTINSAISPTKTTSFLDCQWRYQQQQVRENENEKLALARGRVAHKAFALYGSMCMNDEKPRDSWPSLMPRIFERPFWTDTTQEIRDSLEQKLLQLAEDIRWSTKANLAMFEAEVALKWTSNDSIINADSIEECDWLDEDVRYRSKLDAVWIEGLGRKHVKGYYRDLKTGSSQLCEGIDGKVPQYSKGEFKSLPKNLQLRWSVVVLALLYPDVTQWKVGHWYLDSGDWCYTTWIKREQILEVAPAVWAQIHDVWHKHKTCIETEKWSANIRSRWCDSCEFGPLEGDDSCPAYRAERENNERFQREQSERGREIANNRETYSPAERQPIAESQRISAEEQAALIQMLSARAKVFGYRIRHTGTDKHFVDVVRFKPDDFDDPEWKEKYLDNEGMLRHLTGELADHTEFDDDDPKGKRIWKVAGELADICREMRVAFIPPDGAAFYLERIEPLPEPQPRSGIKKPLLDYSKDNPHDETAGAENEESPDGSTPVGDADAVPEADERRPHHQEIADAIDESTLPWDQSENADDTGADEEPEEPEDDDMAEEFTPNWGDPEQGRRRKYKILLYGPPGVLKTRAALRAFTDTYQKKDGERRIAVIDTEDGTVHYVDEFRIKKLKNELGHDAAVTNPDYIMQTVKAGSLPPGCNALMIDSFTVYCDVVFDKWVQIYLKREKQGKGGHKRDYYVLQPRDHRNPQREIARLVNMLMEAPFHVVITCQVRDVYKKSKDGDGKMMEQTGEVAADAWKKIAHYFDTVVQITRDPEDPEGKLWATVTNGPDVKDRTNRLPRGMFEWTEHVLRDRLFDEDGQALGWRTDEPEEATHVPDYKREAEEFEEDIHPNSLPPDSDDQHDVPDDSEPVDAGDVDDRSITDDQLREIADVRDQFNFDIDTYKKLIVQAKVGGFNGDKVSARALNRSEGDRLISLMKAAPFSDQGGDGGGDGAAE